MNENCEHSVEVQPGNKHRLGQLSMEDLCNMSNRRFVDFYYLYSEFFRGRVAVCKHMHACKIKTTNKVEI